MTSKMRSIVTLVVVLLALGMVTQVMAQSATQSNRALERETTGTVAALTTTTITVNGRVFNIAQAEIKGTISVGAVVKIHFTAALDGTLVAREVEPALAVSGDDDRFDDRGRDDLNDDHDDDGVGHDLNDDHDDDGIGHDLNDDHGRGHGSDDSDDDHSGRGSDDSDDDHSGSGSSGRGGGDD